VTILDIRRAGQTMTHNQLLLQTWSVQTVTRFFKKEKRKKKKEKAK
jgi:hypothetical protein